MYFFRIVLCGGDGTYNEGMNAILRKTQQSAGIDYDDSDVDFVPTKTTIGLIPTGKSFSTCMPPVLEKEIVEKNFIVSKILYGNFESI